jgi:uncharacterized protein YbjT (DUF2867 family)
MKVLVTGATGFVGHEVLRELHSAAHSIRVIARQPRSSRVRSLANQYDLEIHPGDVLEAKTIEGSLAGVDAVVHLVGIISEAGDQTFENVHIRGTQNIVEASRKSAIQRFVHMSALGTRPQASSRYHQSKWVAEEIVRQSGLAFTVFRPSLIYGADDMFVNLFARLSKFSPVLPVMGTGRGKLQPIDVDTVAQAFVKSLTEPKAIGQTYDLCGPDRLTLVEVLDAILAVTGRRRIRLHLPMPLAWRLAMLLEFAFPRLLGRPPPLNRDQLLMLQEDNVGDAAPANRLFGLEPVPFREGIARFLKS